MSAQRTIARQAAPAPKREAARPVSVRAPTSPAALNRAQVLQQRLGNSGTQAFLARQAVSVESPMQVQAASALNVSSPNDPAEREATSVASSVMRMAEPMPARDIATAGGGTLHRAVSATAVPSVAATSSATPASSMARSSPSSSASAAAPGISHQISQSLSGGAPLPDTVRGFMEPRFNASFGHVRIHTGEQAAQMSDGVSARAFTVGNHIYFGAGQYQPSSSQGKELIAHELTHVVQQGGGATAPKIQREEKKGLLDQALDFGAGVLEFGEEVGWGIVRKYSPDLEQYMRKGPLALFDWLKEKAVAAAEGVFDTITAPVRLINGIGARLSAQFAPLVATIQTAAAQIARNDCTPLRDAADKIEKTATEILTPIVATLQPAVAKIQSVLNLLWDKIGAPIWDLIKQYASDQWDAIQLVWKGIKAVASWIWGKTATFREMASKAWTWVKNKLGIGEGPEGEDGLLQWLQRKLSDAWNVVKAKIEPFKKELTAIAMTVGGVALAVSPLGPIAAVGVAVYGAVQGLRWIHANWGKGNIIVTARQYIEKSLIPPLLGAAARIGATVTKAAGSISSALGSLSAGMMRAAGVLGNSVLKLAVSAVQWIADQVAAIADWATDKLNNLSTWITNAVGKLQTFLRNVMTFLKRVGDAVLDVWSLPVVLAEKVWNWVPACLRDPIVDFLGPIILKQIEIFQELVKDDEAWQKTKVEIGKIIRLVFKDRDLAGAVRATFYLILRVFNIPPSLLGTIANKALAAWDVVSKKPLAFIKNVIRSMGHGFKLLWQNIGDHLAYGLQEWLFGGLREKQITPPSSWLDPKAVFMFALDVLNLNVNHIWELLAKRVDPIKVAKLRAFFAGISRAWDWIKKAIDTSKSPQENTKGLIDQAKGFGLSILTGVAEWVAGRVATELALMATAAAASAGLSELLDIARRIYKAIATAVRWARRILDMVNETLDNILEIAGGNIESAGEKFEKILHRGMPVVIGFLADQVGLSGVGQAVRDIVDKLRQTVDDAILWLIDVIKAGIDALIGAVKSGVAAVLNWWKARDHITMVGGEEHELYFKGTEDNAELIVESTPKTLKAYLTEYEAKPNLPASEKAILKQIRAEADLIDQDKQAAKSKGFGQSAGEAIQQRFAKIVALMGQLQGGEKPAKSQVKWSPRGDDGYSMTANVLSVDSGGLAGSQPYYESSLWKQVRRRVRKSSGDPIYVRGHLLNHHLHGPGNSENLVPITKDANGRMERLAESQLKNAIVGENRVFRYVVTVVGSGPKGKLATFPDGSMPEQNLPSKIRVSATELTADGKQPKPGKSVLDSEPTEIDNTIPDVDTKVLP